MSVDPYLVASLTYSLDHNVCNPRSDQFPRHQRGVRHSVEEAVSFSFASSCGPLPAIHHLCRTTSGNASVRMQSRYTCNTACLANHVTTRRVAVGLLELVLRWVCEPTVEYDLVGRQKNGSQSFPRARRKVFYPDSRCLVRNERPKIASDDDVPAGIPPRIKMPFNFFRRR